MPAGEQFLRFFGGFLPDEERIWRKFLREHELEFSEFVYNLHVGEGVNVSPRPLSPDPELDKKLREQFRKATQKRIDAVGTRGSERWIFEVEERPGSTALGQLLFYRDLLPTVLAVPDGVVLAVVAERMGFDNRKVFVSNGVRVFVFPP